MKATAKETVLMENGAFRLTTQRLVQTDGLEAEITKDGNLRISAHGQERTVEIPKKLPKGCAAYHGSIPVLGAMYNLAIKELHDDINPDGHMLAGANWSTVWTRDIAYAVALGAAVAAPEPCRASLDSRVKHGVVMQDTGTGGGWPVSTDRVAWALGVWALFKVTGDRAWLEHCANVLQATLEQDAAVLPPNRILRSGETSFIDWREQSYPDWMTPADIGASYAFGTNVLHYICRQILARMLHLLGRKKEAKPYEEQAAALATAIRDSFWDKGTRQFGIMRLANGYHDERTDSLATALAVLCGLQSKYAQDALARLPRSPWGTPVFAPYKVSQRDAYHNRAVWPFVEAYVMLAHAELSSANTSATVVDVGSPSVLKMSSRMTLATITARNSSMISSKLNMDGTNTPLRATAIMPLEKTAPSSTPAAATATTVLRRAALQPREAFRKLQASLVTPTISPDTERTRINA